MVAAMAEPMIGNLAWAPLPAFGEVEVLDRFNGVPTLGVFGYPGERVLFWRMAGYVPKQELSFWLYVPLRTEDEDRLGTASDSDLLDGLIFHSAIDRQVTIGMAQSYRLKYKYESNLRPGLSPDEVVGGMLQFLARSLETTLAQTEGMSRRKAVAKASEAVTELAAT
jgi:hypothetical protein